MSRAWLAGRCAVFLFLSIVPRVLAILGNFVTQDDYILASVSSDLFVRPTGGYELPDFRIVTGALLWLGMKIPADWYFLSRLPKILACLFLVGFSEAAYRKLRSWGIAPWAALLAPSLVLVHVATNEITLWNTTAPFGLWLWLFTAGHSLTASGESRKKHALGVLLLVIGLFAYEFYFVVFAVWSVAEVIVLGLRDIREARTVALRRLGLFASLSLVYVAVVGAFLTFGVQGRGFAVPTAAGEFLVKKVHAVSDLLANVSMPILTYYAGLEVAWATWLWVLAAVPLGIGLSGRLLVGSWRRAVAVGLAVLGLTGIGVAPVVATNQSPEAWRLALPAILGVSLCLTLLAWLIEGAVREGRLGAWALAAARLSGVGLILILVPVSWFEAGLRMEALTLDKEAVSRIQRYWAQRGRGSGSFVVGRVLFDAGPDAWRPARDLTCAYQPYTLLSSLRFEYSWRGAVWSRGLRVCELEPPQGDWAGRAVEKGCLAHPERCRFEVGNRHRDACSDPTESERVGYGIRLVHDDDAGVSVVCVSR